MTKMIVMMTSIHSMICGTSNAIGFISRYRKFLPQSVQFFCVAGSQNKVTVTDFYRGSSRVNKHLSERGYCKDVLLARSTQAKPLPVVIWKPERSEVIVRWSISAVCTEYRLKHYYSSLLKRTRYSKPEENVECRQQCFNYSTDLEKWSFYI